ncbi:MAG: MFS transporter [Bacteroidetes bacterium]|nr:MFS transporter [Bacteroidota bacterium]
MRRIFILLASFTMMLCYGSLYGWSIVANELIHQYSISLSQTQFIFGSLVATMGTAMVVAGYIQRYLSMRFLGILSALLFALGSSISSFSNGNFYSIFFGSGIIVGIGSGLGYLAALTVPVLWFPERKGLITGIIVSGFGLGALLFSGIVTWMLDACCSILDIVRLIGFLYGGAIFLSSLTLSVPHAHILPPPSQPLTFIRTPKFYILLIGMFLGTFAGLFVVGNLTLFGAQYIVDYHILIFGVSLFSIANSLGRIFWGFISDTYGAKKSIAAALTFQALAVFLLGLLPLTPLLYISLAMLIGLSYSSNFVLFPKETAHVFGLNNLSIVYPYVFLGFTLAGIVGPLAFTILYSLTATLQSVTFVASTLSGIGALLFIFQARLAK